MQQIGIGRERRFAPLVFRNRDLMLLGELDQLLARSEIPFAPRREHFHVGFERIIAELEPDLIVALAGRAVRDRFGADLLGDLDLLLRDERTRDRGAEQVLPLVERIGAEHRKHVIAHEFLAQILDEDVLRLDAEQQRFLPGGLELFALAQIGRERDDLTSVSRLQPFQNDGRIQAARIGEHYFFDAAGCHGVAPGGFGSGRTIGAHTCRASARLRDVPDAVRAECAATHGRTNASPHREPAARLPRSHARGPHR